MVLANGPFALNAPNLNAVYARARAVKVTHINTPSDNDGVAERREKTKLELILKTEHKII